MWGFFYYVICNNMLYTKTSNIIKNNRVDIGEIFTDLDNCSIKGSWEFWEDYDSAKEKVFQFLEKYKNYEVCCIDNVEGTDIRITNKNLYKFFIDYYKKTNKKVILKSNSLNIEYDDNVIYYPCFGFMGGTKYYEITPRKFNNKILFLNRVERWHRTFLYHHFEKKNILKYMDYSINAEDSSLTPFKSIEIDEVEMKNIMDILPNYFSNFLSLITETHFFYGDERDNVIFFTEKIDKVFAVGQPFIIVSVPYYLFYLKKLGFKTFDKWWDESYDLILDNQKRLEKICDIVEEICSLSINELENIYKEMIPILIHNQKLAKFIGNLSTEFIDYTFDDVVLKIKNEFDEWEFKGD